MAIEDQGLEVLAKFAGKPKKDQEYREFKSPYLTKD
jgi:hypothetical protein